MDPNACLAEIRELLKADETTRQINTKPALDRILELSASLDEWLTKGGFLPDAWQHASVLQPAVKRHVELTVELLRRRAEGISELDEEALSADLEELWHDLSPSQRIYVDGWLAGFRTHAEVGSEPVGPDPFVPPENV